MRVVKVVWHDAKTWANAWIDDKDIGNVSVPKCVSSGEVIKEDNVAIYLGQSASEEEYRNIIGIPKGCIMEMEELYNDKDKQ